MTQRGSIALARSLCYQIAGAADERDDLSGAGYGSVDIAEILSAEVLRLQAAQAQAAVEPADRIPDAGETMPVVYIRRDQLQKAQTQALLCEVTPEARQDRIAIYTSPPDALKFRPDWSGVEVLAEELREAQEVMRLALEALHNSLPVGTDPVAICARHDAAIAALEELASHLTDSIRALIDTNLTTGEIK
jgi:hypothetical protein